MPKHFTATSLGTQTPINTWARKILRIWMMIAAVLIIIVFSFALVSSFKGLWLNIRNATIDIVSKKIGTEMQKDPYGNVNMLILGYGGAEHDGGYLTDSMMVLSRNPEIGNVSMFSIPRDLRVKSPVTKGYGRINAIFTQFMGRNGKDAHLSASGTKAEIEMMLDMEIPYYATINFEAFEEVINMLWGIDIIVPETIHDTAYPNEENRGYITFHLDAWPQHLDGETALKYARSRHSTSDFSRSLRQQIIIMGIKDKILNSGLDIKIVPALYEQYKAYVSTNVSLQEMLRTVQYIKMIDNFSSFGFTTNCSFQNYLQMPPACLLYYPERELFGGASVMLPMGATASSPQNYTRLQTFTDFLLSHPDFVHQKASIEILNGIDKALARSKGMSTTPFAGQLAVKLKRYGFNITNTENAETSFSGSYITVNGVGDYTATLEAIQFFLPITDIRYTTENILIGRDENGNEIAYTDGADISIYLGADYLLGSETLSGLVQQKFSFDL